MITVKLSVEEYNRLYHQSGEDADCYYNLVFCEQIDNKIQLKTSSNGDGNIDYVLAQVNVDTLEGDFLSKFLGCTFSVIKTGKNPELYGKALSLDTECFWCTHKCKFSHGEDSELRQKIIFIDPIPFRTEKNLDSLYYLINDLKDSLEDDLFEKGESKLEEIKQSILLLQHKLQNIIDEWDYERGLNDVYSRQ